MEDYRLGVVEGKFAQLIWDKEPLTSRELVELCARELDWKKSTTYTVLKRLCDKGIFRNEGGVVTSRMSREAFAGAQSEKFVEETFGGSLPAFLAAFTQRKPLSQGEIEEIQRMIQSIGSEPKWKLCF